jgi:HEAT repeat protein
MFRKLRSIFLVVVCALPVVQKCAHAADAGEDEQRLKKDLGGADAERILGYLRSQMLTESSKQQISKLIEEMGSANFRQRQAATRKLVEAGRVAIPLLRAATSHTDKEIASRARRCISDIQNSPRADLPIVAIRQLARLKSEKSVDVLLAYLPAVTDDALHDQIMETLANLGLSGKTAHPALKKALDDPMLRSAAVQLLLKSEDPAIVKQLHGYLKDKDPAVRFYVAMHFLKKADREAVPVLIGLIGEAPGGMIWQQSEEALYALAGELAPAVETKSGSAEDRKEAAKQWQDWWKAKGDQVLFGRRDDHPTDTCIVSETGQTNRVFEWRPDGKPRFDLTNLTSPVDARILPGRRVLVAEQQGQRVSEHSFSGKLLWEQRLEDGPISVQRLPSGNTFVATMRRVLEMSRDGQVVYSHAVDGDTYISDANRLTDGRIAIVSTDGKVIFMTGAGKEIKTVTLDSQGAVDSLPNGHVLVSQAGTGRLVEFDARGDKVMDVKVEGAWMGTRLPDGNTLVASKAKRKMIKIDKTGKVIWEKDIDAYPHSIHWK